MPNLRFFSPVIAFGLFAPVGDTGLEARELIGLAFIVSANLVSAIRTDTTFPFRALIASLLVVGGVCALVPLPEGWRMTVYYDALAVLSLFYGATTASIARTRAAAGRCSTSGCSGWTCPPSGRWFCRPS